MRLLRLSLLLPALAVTLATVVAGAQPAPALAGRWEGTLIPAVSRGSRDLHARSDRPRLPTVLIIRKASDGLRGKWAQNGLISPLVLKKTGTE